MRYFSPLSSSTRPGTPRSRGPSLGLLSCFVLLLSLGLISACGASTSPDDDGTATEEIVTDDTTVTDATTARAAVLDSTTQARLDSLRAAAALGDSLADTDLDSLLTALDLDASVPGSAAPDSAASNVAAPDSATLAADSVALPVAVPAATAVALPQGSTDLGNRIAALEGQIEALTEVLAA
ncbi:MAG: hypothetical protein AAFN13_11210, partial [Bacteroidota bacterium]